MPPKKITNKKNYGHQITLKIIIGFIVGSLKIMIKKQIKKILLIHIKEN